MTINKDPLSFLHPIEAIQECKVGDAFTFIISLVVLGLCLYLIHIFARDLYKIYLLKKRGIKAVGRVTNRRDKFNWTGDFETRQYRTEYYITINFEDIYGNKVIKEIKCSKSVYENAIALPPLLCSDIELTYLPEAPHICDIENNLQNHLKILGLFLCWLLSIDLLFINSGCFIKTIFM